MVVVLKAFRFRIYPSSEQTILLHKMFGCSRFVFNHFLVKWNEMYNTTGKGMSYHACATGIPALKETHEWLKEADSIALQSSVRHLADSFDRFFRKQSSAPRFKIRKNPVQSYTTRFTNDNIDIQAVCSRGADIDNPKHLRKQEKKLARWQRIMARRKQGGTNWQCAIVMVPLPIRVQK